MNKFYKQLIFVAIGVAVLVAGGVLIFAIGDKGAAPVGYWKFDEGSGNYAYDSSGNANTGSLYLGGSATSSAWVSGVYGGAMSFDGTDDYVTINEVTGFTDLSFCAWAKSTNSASTGVILENGQYTHLLGQNNSKWFTNVDKTFIDGHVAYSLNNIDTVNWYFLCGVYAESGNILKLYVDGVYQSQVSGYAYYHYGVNKANIGSRLGDTRAYYFPGLIDDVRIYNYARTADQVRNDYNAGKALYVGARAADCDVSPADCINKGLVGHWDMDQMGGTTATDKSGNGNTGTLTSGPVWTQGIQPFSGGKAGGGALQFDGSNDYVDAGQGSSLNGLTSITLSAWIKPYGYTSNYRSGIISRRRSSGALEGLNFTMGGTLEVPYRLAIYEAGSAALYAATTISPNQWSFVTATLSGTDAKIYINGVLNATGTLSWNWPSDVNVSIGWAANSTAYYFNGLIDEARIYNRALSAAEIRYQYNQAKPIAHWKFDEGSGNYAYDSSGNANTGSLVLGGSATSSAWVSGVYGTAMSFDGTDDYVNIVSPTVSATVNSLNFSFSAWVKSDNTNSNDYIFEQGRTNVNGYGTVLLQIASNQLNFSAWDLDSEIVGIVTSYTDTTNFHNVVITSNGTTANLYVDGVFKGSDTWDNGYVLVRNNFYIGSCGAITDGGTPSASVYFDGSIDDVRIYNYARTADQIKTDYNAGKALYVGARAADCDVSPVDCVNKGLVGHWDMDQMGGTTATDKSGNGNTGTLTNGPVWTGGIQPFSGGRPGGGALKFDGTDDYVDVGSATLTTGATTISMWIKSGASSQLKGLGSFKAGGTGVIVYQGSTGITDAAMFGFRTAPEIRTVANTIVVGQWQFFTFVYNGGTKSDLGSYKIYVNGVSQSITGTGTIGGTQTAERIGSDQSAAYWNGLIDDVRIYNRALSEAEIRYQYNQAKPIAHWKMDEGADTATTCNATISSVYDYSGNANTGTLSLSGSPATSSAWVEGKYSCALDFDGSNDYVGINGNPDLLRGSRTYELWFYPHFNSGSGGSHFMLSVYRDDGNETSLYNYSNGFYGVAYKTGGSAKYISAGSFTANNWYHIAATFDDDTNEIKVYHNGVLQNQGTESNAMTAGSVISKIGSHAYAGAYSFDGPIDDVRIYNYARTPLQIQQDYNAGASLHLGQ